MPLARLPFGHRIAYDDCGTGEPVLFIAGLGRDRRMWDAQAPLAERFRMISFDNRGVGGSSRPAGPYSAAQLAADAAGLLSELGIARAHVVGASLGGLIAQELALSDPARVASLSLLCTHPGVPLAVPMSREVLAAIVPDAACDPYERLLGAMRLAFGSAYWAVNAADLAGAARARLPSLPSPEAWWAQAAAGASFSWAGRSLRVPALILTGDEDRIVPPLNSGLLAELIEGSAAHIIPGGGHYFFAEQPELVNRLLGEFLESASIERKEEAYA
ncbi:MAG: alpha/beta fold hydrolase [Elusimicrobia bacterium]|nr:alpha/beta fold hydrolase [Elusimicrobiota bacterium]